MNVLSSYFRKLNTKYTLIQEVSDIEDTYVLGTGEVIVLNDGVHNEKCKIGDGIHKFNELDPDGKPYLPWYADVSEVTAGSNNMLSGTVAVDKDGEKVVGGIPTVEFEAPTITLDESTGKITAAYQQTMGYSDSNINHESEKDLGISTLTVSSPTMNAFGIVNMSYSSTKGYTTGVSSTSKTLNLDLDPEVIIYRVEEVSGAQYDFAKNSDGYWESQNKGVDNSYAICKVHFKRPVAGSTVVFDVINYAQAGLDYAIFGKWNTELSLEASADSSTKCQAKFNSYLKNKSTPQQVVYKITASDITNANGDLWIAVKFIKNGSTSSNNDSVAFKVANGIEEMPILTVSTPLGSTKQIITSSHVPMGTTVNVLNSKVVSFPTVQTDGGYDSSEWYTWNEIPWTEIKAVTGDFEYMFDSSKSFWYIKPAANSPAIFMEIDCADTNMPYWTAHYTTVKFLMWNLGSLTSGNMDNDDMIALQIANSGSGAYYQIDSTSYYRWSAPSAYYHYDKRTSPSQYADLSIKLSGQAIYSYSNGNTIGSQIGSNDWTNSAKRYRFRLYK